MASTVKPAPAGSPTPQPTTTRPKRKSSGGGRTAGAAKGAAEGAVAGPEGAAAGAAAGALSAKGGKSSPVYTSGADTKYRKILVGEFMVCALIVGLSPLTDKHKDDPPADFTIRCAAIAGTFFVLALVSTGGRSAAKLAAAFGGLITVSLAVSSRDIFAVIAARFSPEAAETGPAGPPDQTGPSGTYPNPPVSRGSHV